MKTKVVLRDGEKPRVINNQLDNLLRGRKRKGERTSIMEFNALPELTCPMTAQQLDERRKLATAEADQINVKIQWCKDPALLGLYTFRLRILEVYLDELQRLETRQTLTRNQREREEK